MDQKQKDALGRVARGARERLGLTQAEVARRAKLSPVVYGRVERGLMTPSVPTLRRLCLALGLSAGALLGLESTAELRAVGILPPEEELSKDLRRLIWRLYKWPAQRLALLHRMARLLDTGAPPGPPASPS